MVVHDRVRQRLRQRRPLPVAPPPVLRRPRPAPRRPFLTPANLSTARPWVVPCDSGAVWKRCPTHSNSHGTTPSCGRCTASYTSRLGTAAALATSAMAALRGVPSASRAATAARQSSGVGPTVRTSVAPATTRVTSPRTPSAAQATSSASGAAAYLFVGLRQLAAHRSRPVATERLGHRGQRRLGAVRRLEEHHRPRLAGEVRQTPGPLAGLARQEALEAEPVDRQPGHGERGQHRRRAGYGDHVDARLQRRDDEPVARVGDARHARVGDQQHPLAGQHRLDQGGGARRLVALEVGHHPTPDGHAEVARQPRQPAGVLGGDHVGRGELVGEPWATRRRRVRSESQRAPARPVVLPTVTTAAPERAPEDADRRTGLSRTADGRTVPSAPPERTRAGPQPRTRSSGWVASRRRWVSWRCSCGCGSSARRTSSSSTRPTTPRTPGRCCTSATPASTSTARRPTPRSSPATPTVCGRTPPRWRSTPTSASG